MVCAPKICRYVSLTNNLILSFQLFDLLKKQNADSLKKIQVIDGDLSLPDTGISKDDFSLLQKQVSVVFHVAATVRVDQQLSDVILLNTRGTRDLLELAKKSEKLEVKSAS